MTQRGFIQEVVRLLPCLLVASAAMWANPLLAGEAQYAYDELGRLTTVVDETGNTAIYNYDAVGNLLSIDRFTPGGSGIDIYALLPGKGAIGSQVKIQGYGFSTTPTDNTVTFSGTAATVVSSTSGSAETLLKQRSGKQRPRGSGVGWQDRARPEGRPVKEVADEYSESQCFSAYFA